MKKILFGFLLLLSFSGFAQVGKAYTTSVYSALSLGLKNDNGTTDNSPILRKAIASLPEGSAIYFPGGPNYYGFGDSVAIYKAIKIYGDGNVGPAPFYTQVDTPYINPTSLVFTSATKTFLYLQSSNTNKNPNVIIEKLCIINKAGTTPSAGAGIEIDSNIFNPTLRDVTIQRFYIDVNNVSSLWLTLDHCGIYDPIYCGVIHNNTIQPDAGGISIMGHTQIFSGYSTPNPFAGVYIKGGGGLRLYDIDFNARNTLTPGTYFLYDIYTDFSQGTPTSEMHFTNISFDNYKTNGAYIGNVTGTSQPILIIGNCHFAPASGSGTTYGLRIAHWNNVKITGVIGMGYSVTSPFIRLDTCDNVSIDAQTNASGFTMLDTEYFCTNIVHVLTTPISGRTITWGATNTTGSDLNVSNTSTTAGAGSLLIKPVQNNSAPFLDLSPYGSPGGNQGGIAIAAADLAGSNVPYLNISSSATEYDFASLATGSGTILPFNFYTNGHSGQLKLINDGTITSNGPWTFTGAVNSTVLNGLYFNTNSSGTGTVAQYGIYGNLNAGTTTSGLVAAASFNNYAASTSSGIGGVIYLGGGVGQLSGSRGANTTNFGGYNWAGFAHNNVGLVGDATYTQYNNSAGLSVGVMGTALRANSSAIECAGCFFLQDVAPTFESAVILADNYTQAVPLLKLRVNGSLKAQFDQNAKLIGAVPTASTATFNLAPSSAVNPTSPVSGDLWWNGTNLYFYNGSANKDLLASGFSNPMTTTGDIIYSSSGSTPARLGIGSTNQVFTVTGGVPVWGPVVTSASYTPALTNTTNIASSSLSQAVYSQVGNIVTATVSGSFTASAATTATTLTIALPVNTSTTSQTGVGPAVIALNAGALGYISGYASVNAAGTFQIYCIPTSTTSSNFSVTIQYHTN